MYLQTVMLMNGSDIVTFKRGNGFNYQFKSEIS